ncbi:MAG TPA: hypothetical protein DEG17_14600 [Cyanobacteria bacterium UBA11149]|nr:hypothetical protein [Cyanobacteria bacterium UBA11367]HBE60246.1 hypothetical protein [Cyanobacteria bacterium UBA11366]HBK66497.1 hypothetical protein [Cyanobacteria bacterium UBA11166]HBR76898.1 hypothetical protein [Cyanobacteria bacterium UBA11159]HBS70452.1 hypothetical protein [Cyanobacteria bacterium UBA11153]HBW90067.1 hypothetical protein [Cyanobacteria bacterium UBA11149]HCA94324.1 hypothetical protein [Cyanobacteria bacterium UBA9226]
MSLLRLLVKSRRKQGKPNHNSGGFTLIELLVAMILAALVIGPLLGFMLNILDTDRKEQAKTTSEQEIQAALDYMARDLEQAVFIYDGYGLERISSQLLTVTNGTPVLAFWKREQIPNAVHINQTKLCTNADPDNQCNDSFVYSLVAYYLINNTNNSNTTWSNTARIARFKIRDGIKDPLNPTTGSGSNTTTNYLTNTNKIQGQPDSGFQIFNLSVPAGVTPDATVTPTEDRMNRWKKASPAYTTTAEVLVDYIDQSTTGTPTIPSCRTTLSLDQSTDPQRTDQRMLAQHPTLKSFYACVNSSKNEAYIYLRGNAMARWQKNATYNANNSTAFPSATIRVKSRGFLFVE